MSKLQKFLNRFKNPAFFSAIVGLIYIVLDDAGIQISANHWDQYVALAAILIGVYADPTTPGIESQDKK